MLTRLPIIDYLMSLYLLQFLCRQCIHINTQGGPQRDLLSVDEQMPEFIKSQFGAPIGSEELDGLIYTRIAKLPSVGEQQAAINFYGCLNLPTFHTEQRRLRMGFGYLLALSLALFCMNSIFTLKVVPSLRSLFPEVDAQHLIAPFTYFSFAPALSLGLLIVVGVLSLRVLEYASLGRQVHKSWLDHCLPSRLFELHNFVNQLLLSAVLPEAERHEVSNWLWRNTRDPILEHQLLISHQFNKLIDEILRWQKCAKVMISCVVIAFIVFIYMNCYLSIFTKVAQ
ncbi:MAG TPA: hypothetical protein PKE57_00805 [Cellvibrionaceae bacterium]|nr:hypothetical protein [Cellvibrionaceae bacterium]HMW49605.1 hypothetical protein [Cellvibrionaceae bacterium]HNG61279.1 hypothetical protein [Cellvibrionaceae bacterium]